MRQILHLGLGRFHRGHQCVYYQKSGNWKVISSTMRSADERDKLRAVNLKYPVLELSHDSEHLNRIDCIHEALSLHHDLARLMEVFLSPETEIITLTVTEKGYCLNRAGDLDLEHPGIRNDLKSSDHLQTAIGFLAYGLAKRKTKLTILSCDNLRGNGDKLREAVFSFMKAAHLDVSWIKENVTFPNSMVDRIVPALLPEKILELETRHSLADSELIATETFSQWVVEDKFSVPRPDWNQVGVQFVNDVRPYEEMKLRLLNASHSFLAYAGINRGHQFVHEAICDAALYDMVMRMLHEEVVPTLEIPEQFDVKAYIQQLMERFRSNKLPHQLKQIAMDGSQKMPQRIFSSIQEAKIKGTPRVLLDHAVTEWVDFLWNSRNQKIDDPKADELLKGTEKGKALWEKELRERLLP